MLVARHLSVSIYDYDCQIVFTRSFIMSVVKAKSTRPITPIAPPTYRLGDEQLDPVLAALPSMIASAPLAWQGMRRRWIRKQIAAFHPADALQAGLAGQIVVLRHLAVRTLGVADLGSNSPAQARRLGRAAAATMREGERLECALRRLQKTAVPPGGARAAEGCDLPAGDAGRRNDPVQREADGGWGARPSPSTLRVSRQSASRPDPAKRARCTKATGAVA
jgi:hypothetical protein